MRHILRRREITVDPWRYLGEDAAAGEALIVPFAALRAERERWWSWGGRLGVRLSPADRAEDLVADLPRLDLVAVEFPSPSEGRGYSQGRLLRDRLKFRGELRAVGAGVKRDQVFLLARCGFDSIEPASREELEALRHALSRYDVAYQQGASQVELRRQRFFASGVPSGDS